MTRIKNIGHIHNANYAQTQFSTSPPKIPLFEKLEIHLFVKISRLQVKIRPPDAEFSMPDFCLKSFWTDVFFCLWNDFEKIFDAKMSQKGFRAVLKFDSQKCLMQIFHSDGTFFFSTKFVVWKLTLVPLKLFMLR